MQSEQAIAAKIDRIQEMRLYPEDEQWIKDMIALTQRRPEKKSIMSPEEILTHNERMIRDFVNSTGIFAE